MFRIFISNYKCLTSSLIGYFFINIHLSHLIIFQIVIFSFSHILVLSNVLFSLILKILFLKAHQNYNILSLAELHFNWFFVQHFKTEQIRLLQYLHVLNNNYSTLILAFLFINLPMNAWLTSLIILHNLSTLSKIFILIYIFSQLSGTIAIHFAASYFTNQFNKPNKLLIKLNAICNNVSLSNRLLLANLIVKYHVNSWQMYGITYGPLFKMVMSIRGFSKVINFFSCFN